MLKKITDSVVYVGANDHDVDLFEGQFTVPNGMSYNSYVILDDKIAVMDTIDRTKTEEWLEKLEEALDGRQPDYLVVQHMEPDHSASIQVFAEKYPKAVIVGNKKTFRMIRHYFPTMKHDATLEVDDGDTLELGSHKLTFVMAPMVHWPEVMMTYEHSEKLLFSADGFGKFGALDVEEEWEDEARRYYVGIVGYFGIQVQRILKKAAALDIAKICPLHGPVLEENLGHYLELYSTWSSYEPEEEGICICYTSIYGNTKEAVELLASELEKAGAPKVIVHDLARCDWAEAVSDAFRYDRLVLATTTYNGTIFPYMKQYINHITERKFQNRRVALMENGSWGPIAAKTMKELLKGSQKLVFAENTVTINSAVNDKNREQIAALAKELVNPPANADAGDNVAGSIKGFVCDICGFVYEGNILPDGYICPLCRQGADVFSPIQ